MSGVHTLTDPMRIDAPRSRRASSAAVSVLFRGRTRAFWHPFFPSDILKPSLAARRAPVGALHAAAARERARRAWLALHGPERHCSSSRRNRPRRCRGRRITRGRGRRRHSRLRHPAGRWWRHNVYNGFRPRARCPNTPPAGISSFSGLFTNFAIVAHVVNPFAIRSNARMRSIQSS